LQYWPIHFLPDHEFVGCCGLRPYKLDEGIPELGFHLRSRFWGRSLAPEAATAVIGHAVSTLGAKALAAGHHPEDASRKKVLGKLGFIAVTTNFLLLWECTLLTTWHRPAGPFRQSTEPSNRHEFVGSSGPGFCGRFFGR
jgi:RimJ/RimL family protein N-acetyltransferase